MNRRTPKESPHSRMSLDRCLVHCQTFRPPGGGRTTLVSGPATRINVWATEETNAQASALDRGRPCHTGFRANHRRRAVVQPTSPGPCLMVARGVLSRFVFVSGASMRHVLSALVQNVPGVLSHISGMLASRGYNIDSLAVGETEDPQSVADDLRRRRRRQRAGAGPQAAGEDRHRGPRRRHQLAGLRRARPDADQGRRPAGQAQRNPRAGRDLPRPDRRRRARRW